MRALRPDNAAVLLAIKVGQNVIDYATGREMPADKLTVREVHDFKDEPAKRNALRIAKLKYPGDWNVAPQAVANLMEALRKPPFRFDVVVTQKDLFGLRDPNLIYYPLIYLHGRTAISFGKDDLEALRDTLTRAAVRSLPTPPAAARRSTRRFAGSSRSSSPITRSSRSPATTRSTPTRLAST